MPDVYTPTGPDGTAMHKLRRMVSKSASFQSRSGLTESALYDRCRYAVNDDIDSFPRPFYVIVCVESAQNLFAGGGKNWLLPAGRLGLMIECDIASGMTTENDKVLEVHDFFGNVAMDVADLSADDDSGEAESHLTINRISTLDYWETPKQSEKSTGVFYGCLFGIEWGVPQ